MKKLFTISITVMALIASNVEAKDFLSFKKKQGIQTTTIEEYVNGKAIQTSTQPNSVVKFYAEKTEVGSKELLSWISITINENQTRNTVFDPETISCVATLGDKEILIGVYNPENYKLAQEKKAKKKKNFWTFGSELSYDLGTVAYTNSAKNEFKEKMSQIDALNSECIQISTLNCDTKKIAGKVIFFPVDGKIKRYDSINITVTVGDDVHEFQCDCAIVKI